MSSSFRLFNTVFRSAIYSRPQILLRQPLRRTGRIKTQQTSRNFYTSADSTTTAPPPSFARRTVRALTLIPRAILWTSLAVAIGLSPYYSDIMTVLRPPTSAETLSMFTPPDEDSRRIHDHIDGHHLVAELRSREGFTESRPHLKIPPAFRAHNLTGGTLMGPGKVAVPPFDWTEYGGKSYVQIAHLGEDLCGHPGIVHGGYLATMLDEGLARCCFPALPHNIGMTANLNINYRNPAPAGSFVVLRATTTKVEGRKAWVEGRIETLVGPGETPVVLAEATGLFISPKQAAAMKVAYPVNESKAK